MSHAVVIDYRGVAIETIAICETALDQLCKIDALIEKIKRNGIRFIDDDILNYEKSLLAQKAQITSEVNQLISDSKIQQEKGSVNGGQRELVQSKQILNRAHALQTQINDFQSNDLYVIDSMLSRKLGDSLQAINDAIQDQRKGVVKLAESDMLRLVEIDDIVLREQVYHKLIKPERPSFDDALKQARIETDTLRDVILIDSRDRIVSDIRADLKQAKVDETEINRIIDENRNDLGSMRTAASNEIIDEKVRKETLKIILKLVRKRGFVVDKSNIKLQKDKNEVIMFAQKASGEFAEFKIYLDGRFIYKFDGYEGQACQEDIEPFLDDLQNIYGIEIIDKKEIWRNPDKLTTKKYQTMKHDSQR